MRFLKVFGIFLVVLAFVAVAFAGGNHQGIRDTYQITFSAPVRIGEALLPAGDYTIRHTMEGQDHVMVFQRKGVEVKTKCTLVNLPRKADKNLTVYTVNAAHEQVLQELTFSGDTAKHVF